MANLLEDFQTYFITAGLATTANSFLNIMQDSPDSAVAIYEYQGSGSLPQIGAVTRSIQVVARDKSVVGVLTSINNLYRSLVTEEGILNLTPERWTVIDLRQPPFQLKVDTAGRTYYCFNVGVVTYID